MGTITKSFLDNIDDIDNAEITYAEIVIKDQLYVYAPYGLPEGMPPIVLGKSYNPFNIDASDGNTTLRLPIDAGYMYRFITRYRPLPENE